MRIIWTSTVFIRLLNIRRWEQSIISIYREKNCKIKLAGSVSKNYMRNRNALSLFKPLSRSHSCLKEEGSLSTRRNTSITKDPSHLSSPFPASRPTHWYDNTLGIHENTAVGVALIRKTVDYASHRISIRHQIPAYGLTLGRWSQLEKEYKTHSQNDEVI